VQQAIASIATVQLSVCHYFTVFVFSVISTSCSNFHRLCH